MAQFVSYIMHASSNSYALVDERIEVILCTHLVSPIESDDDKDMLRNIAKEQPGNKEMFFTSLCHCLARYHQSSEEQQHTKKKIKYLLHSTKNEASQRFVHMVTNLLKGGAKNNTSNNDVTTLTGESRQITTLVK